MFARTKNIEVGSAVMSILCNGGPIGVAERIGSFCTLHGLSDEKRKLHIGFSAGRFEFMARPYGIVPRDLVEEVSWKVLRGQVFREASEIFLRLINGEVICSKDITETVLTRDLFRTEEEWVNTQNAAKDRDSLDMLPNRIEISNRYEFGRLHHIGKDPQTFLDCLGSIKNRFLVFLHIFVIRKWQAFHHS